MRLLSSTLRISSKTQVPSKLPLSILLELVQSNLNVVLQQSYKLVAISPLVLQKQMFDIDLSGYSDAH